MMLKKKPERGQLCPQVSTQHEPQRRVAAAIVGTSRPRSAVHAWAAPLVMGIFAAGLLVLSGCKSSPPGPRFDPRANAGAIAIGVTNLSTVALTNSVGNLLQPSTNAFTLGPGDRIELEIFGDNTSRTTVAVGPDGRIYYHLLPGLDVWGMTLPQAKDAIERELGKYVTAPQVGITLRGIDSKRVWLLGRLQNSGVYPVGTPMTLLEAIALAGGTLSSSASGTTEELADLQHSFVVRDGKMLPVDFNALLVEGNMAHNIYLQPDDLVFLPSSLSREVYVLGAVRTPRAVPFGGQATLISAISHAGGLVKNAYESDVAIIRGSLTEPKIAIVNLKAIRAGKAPDVRLEPRDIVYVPLSPYRTLFKYADVALTTFVRAIAINEGARAVSKEAGTVNVGITISP